MIEPYYRMSASSEAAVSALADYLLDRDFPIANPHRRHTSTLRYEYRRRAAAILAGEAWAIRAAWPNAYAEVQG